MQNPTIIQLSHITKRFGGLTALEGVDFDLREGETHALVGENGAGKSTLMRILAGIYTRDEGEYLLNGEPVHLASPHDALRAGYWHDPSGTQRHAGTHRVGERVSGAAVDHPLRHD